MSDTHDFNDGNGAVPAHRHSNGEGWVAETAKVDASAYVGSDAKVYGNAYVCGDARVFGNAQVSGDAMVYGDAKVFGFAKIHGYAMVYGDDNAAKIAELTRKLDALRNEVKAWRDADEREDMLFNTLGEEDRNRILQAITNTDNTGALEDER